MCGCVPWAVIGTFLNDYLAQDRKMGVHNSTLVLTSLSLGGCVGVFSGGLVGQWLYNTRPSLVPLLMGGTTALGIVPVLYLINLPDPLPPLWVLCAAGACGGAILTVTGACVKAVLLNVNAPETRGSALAVYALFDDLGRGFGPYFVALLIGVMGRAEAFSVTVVAGWLVCAGLLGCMTFFLRGDEERLQRHLREEGQAPRCCFA
eukprot:CAMPEP_0180266002 /NCGR_PEP_ID=MMETSP0988-20121125/767_1 /TAXON_ID=697907 /ORGANISM="non described non described, Strain CCMP2293" /LENGTH=204 /DNA_ID=CAMNT_0022236553 /DNA_START=6 /DNA_END=620 /DNA_ORIENTATION=-